MISLNAMKQIESRFLFIHTFVENSFSFYHCFFLYLSFQPHFLHCGRSDRRRYVRVFIFTLSKSVCGKRDFVLRFFVLLSLYSLALPVFHFFFSLCPVSLFSCLLFFIHYYFLLSRFFPFSFLAFFLSHFHCLFFILVFTYVLFPYFVYFFFMSFTTPSLLLRYFFS